jgi:hypothetical protein
MADVKAPRQNFEDTKAPRQNMADVKAPRAGKTGAGDTQSVGGQTTISKAEQLVQQAEAACEAGKMKTAKAKAQEAIALLKR